jgi:hypothetical protein
MADYELTYIHDRELWDSFVDQSPQGNLFCKSWFLDAVGHPYERLMVRSGGVDCLGAVVLLHDQCPLPAPIALTMYHGVLVNASLLDQPLHSRIGKCLAIVDFLLAEMESRYSRISFCLHHQFTDLRSFSWFHYHEPSAGQFRTDLFYTGLIDLSTITDWNAFLASLRRNRRREYNTAQAEGWTPVESSDVDLFDHLYRLTFERHNIKHTDEEMSFVRSLAQAALRQGSGEMLICKNPSGKVACATIYLHDNRVGYSWLAANDPQYRDTGAPTLLILENLRRFKEKGLRQFDFLGINSPKRGDFKTSFNAIPTSYFVVNWDKPNAGLELRA